MATFSQKETPYGKYAQVDLGEKYIQTESGKYIKVYFLLIMLSRSRCKAGYFQKVPFTSEDAIYAHEKCFEYYKGVPQTLIYDQDKLFIKDENMGDYVLTYNFRKIKEKHNFKVVFCRKADPESKGKIENAVKYVKNNFLKGRRYENIEKLNEDFIEWLERTGNGIEHNTTKLIPKEELKKEQMYLQPFVGISTYAKEEGKMYLVRKDNSISYKGRNTYVYVISGEGGSQLEIYNKETGKQIARHKISPLRGKIIGNANHRRNNEESIKETEEEVLKMFEESSKVAEYFNLLHKNKQRYYRDNLLYIQKHAASIKEENLNKALEYCRIHNIYNGKTLYEIALHMDAKEIDNNQVKTIHRTSMKGYDIMPEHTDINTYNEIML